MSEPKVHVGDKFSRLTVVSRLENSSRGNHRWVCLCECGNTAEVLGHNLTGKHATKSCGCMSRLPDGEAAFNNLYLNYVKDAKKRNVVWELASDEFKVLTQQPCHYCGKPPHQVWKGKASTGNYTYMGVDRVDNSIGYRPENCVPCCKICNYAKKAMPYAEFTNWIKSVYEHLSLS